MGDSATGSWDSNGLGGYIEREQSRSRVSYDRDGIQISGMPYWVFHNLLLDHGERFEKGENMCSNCAGDYQDPDATTDGTTTVPRPECPMCHRVRGVSYRQRDGRYVCRLCGHTWAKDGETVGDA